MSKLRCLVRSDRVEVWLRPEAEEPDRAGLPPDLPTVGAHLRRWFGVAPDCVRHTPRAGVDRAGVG